MWLFKCAFHDLYGVSRDAPLDLTLQCGLAALKTPYCNSDLHRNVNCPTCSDAGRILAVNLPYSHHVHSTLICYITKKTMDEDNYPMVLPNGYAYSREVRLRPNSPMSSQEFLIGMPYAGNGRNGCKQ